jgi:succinate dehydrogenase / fumarate reductase flavoprotein subunit
VLELKHMLTVAEAIALAAREREESRGGHFREDFPQKSVELEQVNTRIKGGSEGNMTIERVAKALLRPDLKEIIEEMK